MRLHVRMFGAEQFLHPLARQVLHHVGKLASAVIALAGIPLSVLIREHRPGGLKHSFAHKIFGSDQLQPFMLAADFVIDGVCNLRIHFDKRTTHRRIFHKNLPTHDCNSPQPHRRRTVFRVAPYTDETMFDPASSSTEGPNSGLCRTCRHACVIESDRRSIFIRCELSRTDASFPKYPRLPVVVCRGYETGSEESNDPET